MAGVPFLIFYYISLARVYLKLSLYHLSWACFSTKNPREELWLGGIHIRGNYWNVPFDLSRVWVLPPLCTPCSIKYLKKKSKILIYFFEIQTIKTCNKKKGNETNLRSAECAETRAEKSSIVWELSLFTEGSNSWATLANCFTSHRTRTTSLICKKT